MSEAMTLLVSFAVVFVSGCGFVYLIDYVINNIDR